MMASNKKLLMYVYSDLTTDARVNRTAEALSRYFEVTTVSKNTLRVNHQLPGIIRVLSHALRAYKIVRKEQPDILYCHDYYSAVLVFICIGRRYCKKIVYDAHELIIPEPGESGLNDLRQFFFYCFEKYIINKVDMVVCASNERGEQMANHYKMANPPRVIRNISLLTISNDTETEKILDSLEGFFSTPEPTVVYAGMVMNERKIQELATAVAEMAPKYKLLIVGCGNALDSVKTIAEANPNLKSFFTGAVPYKSLGAILEKCDVGFVFYPVSSLNNKFCASNKIYEYASVGLPMISNENPTLKRVLEQNHLGIASSDFKSAITEVMEDLDSYKRACGQFTASNPWKNDADLLSDNVLSLVD